MVSTIGGAAFARTAGEHLGNNRTICRLWELKETTEENIETGTFSAKDISISGIYTYDLSDYWSGGVHQFIYSTMINILHLPYRCRSRVKLL